MTFRSRWAAPPSLVPDDSYPRLTDLSRIVHREVVLLVVLSALAVAVFVLTQAAAAGNRAQQELDAAAWFERGREALGNHATGEAVVALRRAATRQPDDWTYARTLAEALAADGRSDQSRQLLLRWRARQPDDADVNTHLARLEVASGNHDAAVGFYESALHGRWESDGAADRATLRRELIDQLLAHGKTGAALSHVLTLAANVPDEPGVQAEVAGLFMATGDPARALDHYQRVLRHVPGDAAARAGAGAAAFALDDYPRALAYVRGLPDAPSRRIAGIAAAVSAYDPLRPRLSAAERERRLEVAVDEAEPPAARLPDALAGADAAGQQDRRGTGRGPRRLSPQPVAGAPPRGTRGARPRTRPRGPGA